MDSEDFLADTSILPVFLVFLKRSNILMGYCLDPGFVNNNDQEQFWGENKYASVEVNSLVLGYNLKNHYIHYNLRKFIFLKMASTDVVVCSSLFVLR